MQFKITKPNIMKSIVILSMLLLFSIKSNSQPVLTYDDFKSLIPYAQIEDYKMLFDKSERLLAGTIDDSSNIRCTVRYMNLYAAAGMVTKDQMSYDKFAKHINKYIGQRLVMSAHPCIDSTKMANNSVSFHMKDDVLQGSTITTNNNGTNILFFEYYKYDKSFFPDKTSQILISKAFCNLS